MNKSPYRLRSHVRIAIGFALLLMMASNACHSTANTTQNLDDVPSILSKTWRFNKILVDGTEQFMGSCEKSKRVKFNPSKSFEEYYLGEQGNCIEPKNGTWSYNDEQKIISLSSSSSEESWHLEEYSKKRIQISYSWEGHQIEYSLIAE